MGGKSNEPKEDLWTQVRFHQGAVNAVERKAGACTAVENSSVILSKRELGLWIGCKVTLTTVH